MHTIWMIAAVGLALPTAILGTATLREWSEQSKAIEQQITAQERNTGSFVRLANSEESRRRMRGGEVLVEPLGGSPLSLSGGMMHHWIAAGFVPGAEVQAVVRQMQQYNRLPRYYSPEVVESKELFHQGERFRVHMRLRKRQVITVMLDTVSEIEYGRLDPQHQWSVSHMNEVRDESGEDHGFLWRMNTYWRFEQASDGVFLECEVLTLTRDLPRGLGWAVHPFVSSVPKESLVSTINRTKDMLKEKNNGNSNR